MNQERFERSLEGARKAATVKGDSLLERRRARREYRQTLDLLSVECDAEQWAQVQKEIKNGWRKPL